MSLLARSRALGSALILSLVVLIGAAAMMAVDAAKGADHRDGPAATGAAPLDITDVYAFRSPTANDNLVVAFGVNGLTTPDQNGNAKFSSTGSYLVHVDNNGDLADDATVTVKFDNSNPQKYTITGLGANPITGTVTPAGSSPNVTTTGGIKTFAGLRDDPFFFDLTAFKKFVAGPYVPAAGLRAAADGAPADTFAGTNVGFVVIELPIVALTGAANSNTGVIKAWVSTDSGSGQVDRMAIPAINTALIPDAQKDNFNKGAPATDTTAFQATGKTTIDTLRGAVDGVLNGPVGPQDGGALGNLTSQQVAEALIPDIVTIDFSKPVVFPNGRQLSDDVIDAALSIVLNRTAGITDAINANDKAFGGSFPFLADPFVPAASGLPSTGGPLGDTDDDGISTLEMALIAAGAVLMISGAGLVLSRRNSSN
jgi:hypothetical protein